MTIALLGMVAVLFGALEHESLVLQSDVATSDVQAGAHSAKTAKHADFAASLHESGTEGSYRLESHAFWAAPITNDRLTWRIHTAFPGDGCASVPLHLVQQARSRLVGLLALRL